MDNFWRSIECKMLVYFMSIRNILRPLGIFCHGLEYFSRFGIFYQEKFGNPALDHAAKGTKLTSDRSILVHSIHSRTLLRGRFIEQKTLSKYFPLFGKSLETFHYSEKVSNLG
jgi:hypothetical protein